MLVGALDEIKGRVFIRGVVSHPHPLVAGAVVGNFPAGHAVGVDHASIDEFILYVVGELPCPQVFAADHGPHPLGVEDRVHAFAAAVLGAGEGRVPVLAGAGAVATDALPPFVEHVAPAVAIAGRFEMTDLPGPRIEHIGAGGAEVAKRSPRRLERRAHRHALEHVQQAPGARLERPGRVVRVFRGEPVEHMHDEIGLVVAIGVLEPQHPRLVHHQHAAIEELKAGRTVELVVEDRTLVGLLVAVSVFEDHELVLRRRVAGQPLRVTWHRGDPQSSLGIKRHLHRIGDLRKPRLIGEEPDLEALRHRAGLDELFRRQNRRPALWIFTVGLPWLAKPGLRLEEVAGARIVGHRRHGLPRGEIPDPAVADCRHLADLHVLAGKRLRVPGAAAAIDIPAVDHPIVLHVHP